MDRQTATQLIGDTFNRSFDEGRFRNFAINLLNDVNEQKRFDYISGAYIRHSFKNHITKYRRLGTYTDPNGEKIDVLVVKLKNEWALERSRTMLRNFTSDYLKNRDKKDAALVAYYTNNPDDWRFSYIRMEYKREKTESGKFKITQDITPAKRYSFLVGKNEPNHTAQSQLVGILADDRNNPTLTELETAFSVDAVTKQFYKDYRDQFEKLWNELNDIVAKDQKIAEEFKTKTIDTDNFAKKLMGQIVFLYFLQKKGWLGVGKDESGNFKPWGTGPKNFLRWLFDKEFTDYGNFFNEVLEPLFYEALATERTNDVFTHFNCKIPFLNGGLFEPINDYNWEETDIRIDNDLIGDVFKTFDQYNFTVREDEPLEKEVAVDPEMLGKVFENLLPENLRKGKGAYYTPRTIVHYMCQESLINYLDTQCEPVPKEDIETLIREGDIILELETAIVEQGKKYKSVLMDSIKDNAEDLDDALANIKVCDPAIGSGAFPVGMLTEIVKARKVLELYLGKKHGVYELKRHGIQNSIYGVDINPGAIEIAKLRLWLSLVVDEDDYTNIQPLPNLDYKIMQGNSLIEEFHGISLDIEKKVGEQLVIGSDVAELDKLVDDLHQKQDDFFNAEHPREKKKKRDAVETAIYNIFHNELEKKKNLSPQEANAIETDLKEMTHGNQERNFFPWKLYFADVFREKGGFDVVIGNPPWGADLSINEKKLLKDIYETIDSSTPNSFAYFIGLSFNISIKMISFVLPDSILIKDYSKTRKLIYKSLYDLHWYQNTGGVPEKIRPFYDVEHDVSVIVLDKDYEDEITNIQLCKYDFEQRKLCYNKKKLARKEFVFPDYGYSYNLLLSQKDLDIYNKLKPLNSIKEIMQCHEGIHTGNMRSKLFHPSKINTHCKPLFFGARSGDKIDSFYSTRKGWFVDYRDSLINKNLGMYASLRDEKIFRYPKIYISRTGNPFKAFLDEDSYASNNFFSLQFKNYELNNLDSLKSILGFINSKFSQYIIRKIIAPRLGNTYVETKIIHLLELKLTGGLNDNKSLQSLADQILTAKKANPQADTTALEAEIDQLVYELYGLTDEEIAIVEDSVG